MARRIARSAIGIPTPRQIVTMRTVLLLLSEEEGQSCGLLVLPRGLVTDNSYMYS